MWNGVRPSLSHLLIVRSHSGSHWESEHGHCAACRCRNKKADMSLGSLLDFWKYDLDTAPNLIAWRTLPPRPAQTHPFPEDLPAPVKKTLIASGIHLLYSHQLEAWTHARAGENIGLATGTASGKTLAYNLPVFASLLQNDNARALYLFPTKALTQDQLSNLLSIQTNLPPDTWNLASS